MSFPRRVRYFLLLMESFIATGCYNSTLPKDPPEQEWAFSLLARASLPFQVPIKENFTRSALIPPSTLIGVATERQTQHDKHKMTNRNWQTHINKSRWPATHRHQPCLSAFQLQRQLPSELAWGSQLWSFHAFRFFRLWFKQTEGKCTYNYQKEQLSDTCYDKT